MEYGRYLTELKKRAPLVHNMTNQVVANFVANGLLALGASPIMAYEEDEIIEMTQITQASALNIGTLTKNVLSSMHKAAIKANELDHPLILDPVGVGATQFRRQAVNQLLTDHKFTLIRGNSGEIATLCDIEWQTKGVDSGQGEYDLKTLAKEAAKQLNTIVAISGEIDWISDGETIFGVKNGSSLMTKVTGMGCLLTAVCAAFLFAECSLNSVVAAHAFYGAAGDKTAEKVTTPGQFQIRFLDELALLTEADVQRFNLITSY